MSKKAKKEEIKSRPIFSDETSFEVAFKEYYHRLFRLVYPILKSDEQAQDLVQDLFVRLWQKKESIIITGSLKSYLFRAAINASFDQLEKSKKEVRLDTEHTEHLGGFSVNDTEEYMTHKETEGHIVAAMNKLPPACKTVFLLSREQEMSYQEIASSLQISVKTVENQIGKALRILREDLRPYLKDFIKLVVFYLSIQEKI